MGWVKRRYVMQKRLKLKSFRVGLDILQEDMAITCGVSRGIYSAIEQGRAFGSPEFWYNLKTKFNLSPDEVWEMQYEGK